MEQSKVLEVLKQVRNRKRNFSQTVELVVSLKDLDLKKPEQQVDLFIALP
ncbi:50S ribosomal protein L1, partial [Candidatus Woesearchaeota archaeon]|nr:50S ribosomal protein L1 [Candidatus Woesearchaeota archaeon]